VPPVAWAVGCRALNGTLTALEVADNDLEGRLDAVAGASLMLVNVHNNKGFCGMVPHTVRYAKGYNPVGTQLGRPCGCGGTSSFAPASKGKEEEEVPAAAPNAAEGTSAQSTPAAEQP
jgi:hypothetical protein